MKECGYKARHLYIVGTTNPAVDLLLLSYSAIECERKTKDCARLRCFQPIFWPLKRDVREFLIIITYT